MAFLSEQMMYLSLGVVLLLAFIMPFASRKIEHNMEVFYFCMGLAAAIISGALNKHLALKAVEEPLMISGAVLIAGLLFRYFQKSIALSMGVVKKRISYALFFFLTVVILGLISSIITAIIASLVLIEIINALRVDRKSEIALAVIACLSIGLGAALTPIGEPLATIAIAKLNQDFFYLLRTLGWYIVPGILVLGLFAAVSIKPKDDPRGGLESKDNETIRDVTIRALKVYVFVAALILLGEGFKPVVDRFVLGLGSKVLYWINMISAILDNATLTAAEISNKMSLEQITAILMGLLISGVMLIPGNIPNIITAGKLKITSKEWAALGVPLGLAFMCVYFIVLFFIPI
jgi:predicted cation transporter